MTRFLIIADDFTGANDTGVQLKKRGLETHVVLDSNSIEEDDISYVVDTESRGLDKIAAYLKVKEMVLTASKHSFQYVYKKLDSTLRGNIGSEIRAVDEVFKPDLILFSPAYPENKRTTIDCIQMVDELPITQTEFSKDPLKPVLEDNIKTIIETELKEEVVHVYLEDLRRGNIDFSTGRIFSFDALNIDDMMAIAKLGLSLDRKILWVGSAGLANAMLEVLYPIKPVLAVVGSVSDVSRGQVNHIKSRADIIRVDINMLLNNNDIKPIVNRALDSLVSGKDTILVSALTRSDYESSIKIGKDVGRSADEVSKFTQEILGMITKDILNQFRPSGMFLTGGDTAIGVINAIESTGSKIIEELIAGIPFMTLKGGLWDGLNIVTKAGAFGNEDALEYCIKKLKEKCK